MKQKYHDAVKPRLENVLTEENYMATTVDLH